VIPAALAAAEQLDARGDELLAAVAAGYEVCCRVGLALGQGAYARGFHPTAVAGVFGAGAAVARVRRLGAEQTAAAFGLAGSMASGSMQYLDSGSWNKRLHPGLAAHNGLLAVDLAAAGVIGARDALEGRLGFLHGYSKGADATALGDGLGERWLLAETGIKPYPACRLAHGAVDAALAVRERIDGAATPDANLELRISPGADTIVGGDAANKRLPQNTVDGQFSVYFQTAVALLDGEVTWSSYQRLHDSDVVALMERIELTVDPGVPIAGAVLRCGSGDTAVEVRIEQPLGEPELQLPWENVEAKYRALAAPLLSPTAVAAVAAWARALPDSGPVRALTALLRAGDR
jgi:2-methylcitrate dehydratase PrpD